MKNPTKRNKDTKEVAKENIEQTIDNEDPAIGEPAEEEEEVCTEVCSCWTVTMLCVCGFFER